MIAGFLAGAAGEFAANVLTFGEMFIRARPASQMPTKTAARLADVAGLELAQPGERPDKATNRQEAAGGLLTYLVALSTALLYAAVRRAGLRLPVPVAGLLVGAAAMAAADTTATVVGATDPKEWGVDGWLLDIASHAAYGIAVAATVEGLDP